MSTGKLEQRARKFFEDFVEAFASFNGAKIAERYACPYLAFHPKGRFEVFLSSRDIAAYFQRVVDKYYERGVRSCSFKELECVPVGCESALATVTWILHGGDGGVLLTWRESYNLWLRADTALVFASTDHVGYGAPGIA